MQNVYCVSGKKFELVWLKRFNKRIVMVNKQHSLAISNETRHGNPARKTAGSVTYQAEHDEEDLDDVGVGDGDEAAEEGVAQSNNRRHDDGRVQGDIQHHL